MPVCRYDENGVEIVGSWSPDDNNLLDGLLMSMRDLGMGRGDYDKNNVIRDPDDDFWQADDKHWGFGVEIEMVVKPRTIYDLSSNEFSNDSITYWSHKLVKLLEGKGLSAVAAPPENHDKWFITQDASLEHGKNEGGCSLSLSIFAPSQKLIDTCEAKFLPPSRSCSWS